MGLRRCAAGPGVGAVAPLAAATLRPAFWSAAFALVICAPSECCCKPPHAGTQAAWPVGRAVAVAEHPLPPCAQRSTTAQPCTLSGCMLVP
jgi:hypothetical protein